MKTAITLVLLVITTAISAQIKNVTELLQASERYYNSLSTFSIVVTEKYKSAIDERVSESTHACFIDKPGKIELFNTYSGGYMVRSGNEFSIRYIDSSFIPVKAKKKEWIYASKYSRDPFINFEFLKKEIAAGTFQFTVLDSIYQLAGGNSIFEFRKSDASLSRIFKSGNVERVNGYYTKEIKYAPVQNNTALITAQIARAEAIIKSNKKTDLSKPKTPKKIDTEILNDPRIHWFNGKPESLAGKKIVLDFFFQGCYPCVLSYPEINELYNNRDSNTVVIGIDSTPADSLSAEVYLSKHELKHPIATGKMAKLISDQLVISGWPTFIVIDENGKIIFREEGYSKGNGRRIRRAL